jgi:hypothetical protein
MVKVAENKKKVNPLAGVYGLFLAIGLYAISYILCSEVILKIPAIKSNVGTLDVQSKLLFSVGLWIVLLGLSFFLVAILSGNDPEKTSNIPLPPKGKDKKR